MRRFYVVLAAVVVLGACAGESKTDVQSSGSSGPAKSTTSAASSSGATFATTLVNGKPHFATPEEAMRYLADAWNHKDLASLKHVTDPSARDELDNMHGVATNLRLKRCEKNPIGDYTCYFAHDYPPHPSTTMPLEHQGEVGEAVFLVGPADTPGWYMTVFESCS